jgi:hypothetical protein
MPDIVVIIDGVVFFLVKCFEEKGCVNCVLIMSRKGLNHPDTC